MGTAVGCAGSLRPSTAFLLLTALLVALHGSLGIHAWRSRAAAARERHGRARLVEALRLTDLCLFTEARYTRHLSMADLHAPFQDHPGAREHFPSGSLAAPPPHLIEP